MLPTANTLRYSALRLVRRTVLMGIAAGLCDNPWVAVPRRA